MYDIKASCLSFADYYDSAVQSVFTGTAIDFVSPTDMVLVVNILDVAIS